MIMKTSRMLMFLLGLALTYSAWSQAMRAQDNFRAKATKVTVTEPMQVPGMVLSPGEYTFRLNDSDSNRHIVQIFNSDETRLVTTVLAIPNARLKPTAQGIMTYEERPIGQPVALGAWFYSGETLGQQFVYPKSKAEELSRLNRVEVPSTGTEQAYSGGAAAETPVAAQDRSASSQAPEPTYSASARSDVTTQAPATSQYGTTTSAAARQEPGAVADPTPAPARQGVNPNASPETLPNTASLIPLVGLLGSLLIGVTLLLKLVART
jgi:hypothetical protein